LIRLPELLAPAGSPLSLKAAIAAGADAVYLSGMRFGARRLAENFDKLQLKRAIDYAHLRGVKIYVTVNTLIEEEELQDVANYFVELYEIGADAVLIQDVGAASLARYLIPELDLHASTQMTIHNSAGMAWAAKMNFKRVVMAREVSLEEIKAMPRYGGLCLEVFIHGALCYCYSGQCLLSSAIGGRSGNRGLCAQPCRKPYRLLLGAQDDYGRPVNLELIPSKDRFLISTRDLSIYNRLEEIVYSPIDSLKIEGRMRSPEYVAIVTSIYRKALDSIAQRTWQPSMEDIRDLALAFNRDFTEGYLMRSESVMGREMSENRGILIGTVCSYDSASGEASIRPAGPFTLEKGDGIVFISPHSKEGQIVNKPPMLDGIILKIKTYKNVDPGARVYQTSSKSLSKKAQQIISKERIQIPIDLEIVWRKGTLLAEGSIKAGKWGQAFKFKSELKMEEALSKPLTSEQIAKQICKTGGTPFFIRELRMDYPGGFFSPLSIINRFRRSILAKAEELILQVYRPKPIELQEVDKKLKSIDFSYQFPSSKRVPSLAVYANSLEIVEGAVKGGCDRIYFEPCIGSTKERSRNTLKMLHEAKSICGEKQLIWKWPKVTRDSYLHWACGLVANAKVDGVMVEGLGVGEAVRSLRQDARIYGSVGLNIWNHFSVWHFFPIFSLLTLSPELSVDQISELVTKSNSQPAPKLELIAQGNQEVMVAEDCILSSHCNADFYGLHDSKRIFPITKDDDFRTHIYNSAETCLLDYMPILFKIGLDSLAIDARNRSKKYAQESTEIYLEAINLTKKGNGSLERNLQALKDRIQPIVLGGMTSGCFLKARKDELGEPDI
jgi:U32 family peptidase